jgi:hypothetical protein
MRLELARRTPEPTIIQARLPVHRVLSDFRQRENGVAAQDAAGIDRIPA